MIRNSVVLVLAIVIGAIFIYAGIDKIRDPFHFADSINAFAILAPPLINPLALGLPIFEIACGGLIVLPWTRRIGALALVIASAMFFLALLSALLRGLVLDCGCFGAGVPSRSRMWTELGLDLLLVVSAAFVYVRSVARSLRGSL
jgi:putative oxidoreductase